MTLAFRYDKSKIFLRGFAVFSDSSVFFHINHAVIKLVSNFRNRGSMMFFHLQRLPCATLLICFYPISPIFSLASFQYISALSRNIECGKLFHIIIFYACLYVNKKGLGEKLQVLISAQSAAESQSCRGKPDSGATYL